jgi:hypothetical protein
MVAFKQAVICISFFCIAALFFVRALPLLILQALSEPVIYAVSPHTDATDATLLWKTVQVHCTLRGTSTA